MAKKIWSRYCHGHDKLTSISSDQQNCFLNSWLNWGSAILRINILSHQFNRHVTESYTLKLRTFM